MARPIVWARNAKSRLFVEPDVFHAPTVEDAVGRDRQPLDIGLPADGAAPIKYDRPGTVFGKPAFNRPDKLLALLGVGFGRLLVDQLVYFGVAVSVKVGLGTANIVRIEGGIGIVDEVGRKVEADRIVLAHDLGNQLVVSIVSNSPSI